MWDSWYASCHLSEHTRRVYKLRGREAVNIRPCCQGSRNILSEGLCRLCIREKANQGNALFLCGFASKRFPFRR